MRARRLIGARFGTRRHGHCEIRCAITVIGRVIAALEGSSSRSSQRRMTPGARRGMWICERATATIGRTLGDSAERALIGGSESSARRDDVKAARICCGCWASPAWVAVIWSRCRRSHQRRPAGRGTVPRITEWSSGPGRVRRTGFDGKSTLGPALPAETVKPPTPIRNKPDQENVVPTAADEGLYEIRCILRIFGGLRDGGHGSSGPRRGYRPLDPAADRIEADRSPSSYKRPQLAEQQPTMLEMPRGNRNSAAVTLSRPAQRATK